MQSNDKLHVAFQKMVEYLVYSLPVMDGSSKFIGLLSLNAVVARLVGLFGERSNGLAHLSSHEFSAKEIADITYQFQNMVILSLLFFCVVVSCSWVFFSFFTGHFA